MKKTKQSFRSGYITNVEELRERYPGVLFDGKHFNVHATVTIGTRSVIKNGAKLINGCTIGNDVTIGEGTLIGRGAWVGNSTLIGRNATVQDDAVIGHSCNMGMYSVVGMSTRTGAHCVIKDKAHVCDRVTLADHCTIEHSAHVKSRVALSKCTRVGTGSVIGTDISTTENACIAAGTNLPNALANVDKSVAAVIALNLPSAKGISTFNFVKTHDDESILVTSDGETYTVNSESNDPDIAWLLETMVPRLSGSLRPPKSKFRQIIDIIKGK